MRVPVSSTEAGNTLSGEGATPPAAAGLGWSRSFGPLNPLRAVWWLFTSVRFAIVLLAALSAISLVGVLLPQVPPPMRGNPALESAWLQSKEDTFGFLTQLDNIGLFDIFHARWFAVLLAVTAISTGAYVISRFAGVWTAITRPRMRVPERYFDIAPNRLQIAEGMDIAKLTAHLRRTQYRVERFEEPGVTYVFADRFQWAQLASLLTHVAVIVFILSAVVSRVDAFSSPLFLSEGSTLPVFPVSDANQMQVELVDEYAAFAGNGQPLDYSSELVIYQRGEEVKRCFSTVNSPCGYNGYRFYQSAYFGFGAAVQVRDLDTGNVIYRETLALSDTMPSPNIEIRDASGALVLDEALVLTDNLSTGELAYSGALVRLPGERLLTIGLQSPATGGEQQLIVIEPGEGDAPTRLSLSEGETGDALGLAVTYVRKETTSSLLVPDLPLPPSAHSGATGDAFLQMSNVIYGTATASEGTNVEAPVSDGPPRLTIVGLRPQAVSLSPGESMSIDSYEYTFLGQREFAGIHVRRNRSDYLVWAGAALLVIGVMVTFWVPRRRLWAKITATRTMLAGQAPGHANYTRELKQLARRAGARVSEGTGEDD